MALLPAEVLAPRGRAPARADDSVGLASAPERGIRKPRVDVPALPVCVVAVAGEVRAALLTVEAGGETGAGANRNAVPGEREAPLVCVLMLALELELGDVRCVPSVGECG